MNAITKKITFDATGKRLGRLASDIATVLNGKNTVMYVPNHPSDVIVEVSNVSHMQITERKKKGKVYDRYTGYFGGRREETLEQVIIDKGYQEVLRRAVYGMLPDNRLRRVKMKKLHIQG